MVRSTGVQCSRSFPSAFARVGGRCGIFQLFLPICQNCGFPFYRVFYPFFMNFMRCILSYLPQLPPLTPPRPTLLINSNFLSFLSPFSPLYSFSLLLPLSLPFLFSLNKSSIQICAVYILLGGGISFCDLVYW